ncbi:MAG: cytochrome c3 family protein [Planctomycetota bacterium]
MRSLVVSAASVLLLLLTACGREEPRGTGKVPVPGKPGATKTSAVDRAARRAYDGSPPTIPHDPMGMACLSCHGGEGKSVPGIGFSPPAPHGDLVAGALNRCNQCHVYRRVEGVFVASSFQGLAQDLRKGSRLYDGAPPRIPHSIYMRQNCKACHTGPAAREEIRTSHPDRTNCRQCHLEVVTEALFAR